MNTVHSAYQLGCKHGSQHNVDKIMHEREHYVHALSREGRLLSW